MSIFRFEGIYTPLVTPFDEAGQPDYAVLSNLIEFLIEKGVHGLISGGSTGENYAQTLEERLEIAKFTQAQIKGRVPFIVGTGAMLTKESLELARAAREMGATAILLASPPYAVPTEEENALNALAIDQAADLPVMLYNYPGRTGTMMGDSFLDHVSKSRNFCGIKESSGDINRVHALALRYPHIQLGCGMDDQALEFFAWGAKFWVCGGSNFLPEAHGELYRACVLDNDFVKGRQIMAALMPLMNELEQGGKFVQTIKYGTCLQGIEVGKARAPMSDLEASGKERIEEIIKNCQSTLKLALNLLPSKST